MHAKTNAASVLETIKIPVQLKLAALWTSYMFVYAYADILGFYTPGIIEDILAGTVWQFEITQTWAVGAFALTLVPILMVFLSLTLPARANRTTNIVVAALYAIVSVGNAIGESWIYYYGLLLSQRLLSLNSSSGTHGGGLELRRNCEVTLSLR